MAVDPFKAGGALFHNDRKTPGGSQPDMSGSLTIDTTLLNAMIALHKAGQPMKMRLASWNNQDRSGGSYLSVKPSLELQQGQQPGGFQQRQQAAPQPYLGGQRQAPAPRPPYGQQQAYRGPAAPDPMDDDLPF